MHNSEDAEKLYRDAVEINEKVLGPDHLNTLISLQDLALLLKDRQELAPQKTLKGSCNHRQLALPEPGARRVIY
jgi:hypothetical protein